MSRSGEIGRHATFRALCLKWHGGSSPPFGMPSKILAPHYNSSEAISGLELVCVGDIVRLDSNLTANVTISTLLGILIRTHSIHWEPT